MNAHAEAIMKLFFPFIIPFIGLLLLATLLGRRSEVVHTPATLKTRCELLGSRRRPNVDGSAIAWPPTQRVAGLLWFSGRQKSVAKLPFTIIPGSSRRAIISWHRLLVSRRNSFTQAVVAAICWESIFWNTVSCSYSFARRWKAF